MSYKNLSLAERHYIELERKSGKSFREIDLALGRSQSTISREARGTKMIEVIGTNRLLSLLMLDIHRKTSR